MRVSLWVRMDTWVRHLIPAGVTLLMLLLSAIPNHLPGLSGIMPLLPLMGVYYWAIFRPDLLPAWVAFLIGLLADILSGTPLGIYALVLLLVQGVAAAQRKFFLGKSFAVTWWAFGLLAAGSAGLAWGLMCLLNSTLFSISPLLFSYGITMGLFPILTWMLARTQMIFLKDV